MHSFLKLKRVYPYSILSFTVIFMLSFTFSDSLIDRIIYGFNKYLKELPQEKVYLHIDRSFYSSGETIWLKAYLTAGEFHEPSKLSTPIYVDIISKNSRLVTQSKLMAASGLAKGSIILPDTLSPGIYSIRAYTNWMKNGSEDYFFHRSIKILGNGTKSAASKEFKKQDIQFFPEGGSLVYGLSSRVGFKAIDQNGQGLFVVGKVVDNLGTVVSEFKSNKLGMGAFFFTPQSGTNYTAIVEGVNHKIDLSVVKNEGVVMFVRNSSKSNDLFIRIQATDFTALRTIYIIAQTRGIIGYTARVNLTSNLTITKIPKENFPSGISQVTILDENGTPLCERLVYVDNKEDVVNLAITSDKSSYNPRESVTLKIQAKDNNGQPLKTNLSLSVLDGTRVPSDLNQETIHAYLLLSSELRGYVESPGYYFNPDNTDREEALDYLLLTQGWRRFTYTKALDTDWERPHHEIERGLSLQGKLVNKHNNKPVVNGEVSYLATTPLPALQQIHTTTDGRFLFQNLIFYETDNVVLQGETKSGSKDVKFQLEEMPENVPINFIEFPFQKISPTAEMEFIVQSEEAVDTKTILLNEVTVKGKSEDPATSSNKIFGKGSVHVKVKDDLSNKNILHPLQLIQGRVAGVKVSGSGQNWSVLMQGVGSINSGTNPLIMINDTQVQLETLSTLPVYEIESFTVWKGSDAAIFGARGTNGAIGFYTKKDTKLTPQLEGSMLISNRGFHNAKEFYSPKYEFTQKENVKSDKRLTLYWNPSIETDINGNASVSFYNHDLEAVVTGVLEGISYDGKSGSTTFKYEIKKSY